MDASTLLELRTGRRMPVIGLGTWLFDDGVEGILRAIRAGYRMIDTSGDYGTHGAVGGAVHRSGLPREALYVVTKVEEDDDAREAAGAYVAELGLSHADLILVHRPPDRGAGVELWHGLIGARADGVARDIGVSNYSIPQIKALIEATGEVPAVNQVEWTPFGHSPELLDFCRSQGIVLQAYSPLTRAERLEDPVLTELSELYGRSPAQILLRWDLQLGVVPLPKARGDHIEENLGSFDFELRREDLRRLGELNERWSALAPGLLYV